MLLPLLVVDRKLHLLRFQSLAVRVFYPSIYFAVFLILNEQKHGEKPVPVQSDNKNGMHRQFDEKLNERKPKEI